MTIVSEKTITTRFQVGLEDNKKVTIRLNGSPEVTKQIKKEMYRNSTGTLPPPRHYSARPHSPNRRYHERSHSPSESICSECYGNSLPLNTPWSSSESFSGSSRARRRSSVRGERPLMLSRGHSPHRPLIVQKPIRAPSPPPSTAYTKERSIIVPSSSIGRRRKAESHSSYHPNERRRSIHYDRYSKDVDVSEYERDRDIPREGRTKFPKKLVKREAVEELGYPFQQDEDGAIVILQALGRGQIEELVDLSEEIRHRRRDSSEKSVSFYEKAIVHETPVVPPPPPPDVTVLDITKHEERSGTPLTVHNVSRLGTTNSSRSDGPASTYAPAPTVVSGPLVTHSYETPLHPPGPSATRTVAIRPKTLEIETPAFTLPGGKSAEEKIARAEEKAIKAEKIATQKEIRAEHTHRARDEHEAFKARVKAEELKKKVEEKEWKERLKAEERELKKREEREANRIRVGKNAKGEIILIKG